MGEVITLRRPSHVARPPLLATEPERPRRTISHGAQVIADIDRTILVCRYDESLEQTLVSLAHCDLFVEFDDGFSNLAGRRVVLGKARLSLGGKPTKFVRNVAMAALHGPDILVGRDLISSVGLPAAQ
jgi:hypothetical protein